MLPSPPLFTKLDDTQIQEDGRVRKGDAGDARSVSCSGIFITQGILGEITCADTLSLLTSIQDGLEGFMARIEEIVQDRLKSDSKLQLLPTERLHQELLTDMER